MKLKRNFFPDRLSYRIASKTQCTVCGHIGTVNINQLRRDGDSMKWKLLKESKLCGRCFFKRPNGNDAKVWNNKTMLDLICNDFLDMED